jgi:hypothetical protein
LIDASVVSSDFLGIVRIEALLAALLVLSMPPLSPRTAIADADGDGVPDVSDNCSELPNADQADRELDGFGNVCDADCTGDDVVGGPDYTALSLEYGATGCSVASCACASPPSFDDPSGPIPGLGTHEIFGHALAEWFHTSAFPDPPGTVSIGDGGSGLRGFGITAVPPGFQTRAEVCSRALAKPFVE